MAIWNPFSWGDKRRADIDKFIRESGDRAAHYFDPPEYKELSPAEQKVFDDFMAGKIDHDEYHAAMEYIKRNQPNDE